MQVAVLLGDPTKLDPVKPNGVWSNEDYEALDWMRLALSQLRYDITYFDQHDDWPFDPKGFDVILNLCDEGLFNDPTREAEVVELFEPFGVPITGCRAPTLRRCYDKLAAKNHAKLFGISIPKSAGSPVIIKPRFGDSSVGISEAAVFASMPSAYNRLEALRHDGAKQFDYMIEEFLPDTEYTIPVVEGRALPTLEVDWSAIGNKPRLLTYDSKWNPESDYWKLKYVPSQTDLSDLGRYLFYAFDCRGSARFDFRRDALGRLKFMEANPNPGWVWDGKMALAYAAAGLDYACLFDDLICEALKRET